MHLRIHVASHRILVCVSENSHRLDFERFHVCVSENSQRLVKYVLRGFMFVTILHMFV